MTRKKIGLALGSGGARGLAHIGVIKKLVEENIPIDLIVGSSAGALIGGMYAALGEIGKVEEKFVGLEWRDWLNTFADPVLGLGFIKGEKAENWMRAAVNNVKIEELKIPFGAVTTDLNTAEEVLITEGDLTEAVRSSGSVPGLFQPMKWGDRMVVDGGLSYPVPVELAKRMGAELVIAVNLDGVYFEDEKTKNGSNNHNILSVLRNSLFLLRYHLAKKEIKEAEVVIEPDIPYIMDLDFVHQEKIIEGGYRATEEMIEKIKGLI